MHNVICMHAASCDYPLQDGFDFDPIQVAGYRVPALQGTIVRFSCPTGQLLKGLNMTTCTSDGKWEPDPSMGEMKCECKRILWLIRHSSRVFVYTHPHIISWPCTHPMSFSAACGYEDYTYIHTCVHMYIHKTQCYNNIIQCHNVASCGHLTCMYFSSMANQLCWSLTTWILYKWISDICCSLAPGCSHLAMLKGEPGDEATLVVYQFLSDRQC